MYTRLFETANKNVLPFKARLTAYNNAVVEQLAEIEQTETDIQYLKTELAQSEAQLNRIMLIGDRLKGAVVEEWYGAYQYQMGISMGWEERLEISQTTLAELREKQEFSVKALAMATEWWHVITKLTTTAYNHQQSAPLETPLETYLNLRHDLDVVIYLPQMAIDEHYFRIERMKNNNMELNQAQQKLRGLCEQMERIKVLGERMAACHQEVEAIMSPLRIKIDKTRKEVEENVRLQKDWEDLIQNNSLGIEQYKYAVAQLEAVRTVVEELVAQLEI
jgi:hypothetical protein